MKQTTDNILSAALNEARLDSKQLEALLSVDRDEIPEVLATACVLNCRFNGEVVTITPTADVCYTDVCAAPCAYCDSLRPAGRKNFLLSADDVVRRAAESKGAVEVALLGAANPKVDLAYATGVLRAVKKSFPSINIRAFSPFEVSGLAAGAEVGCEKVLAELQSAGLGSLEGVFADTLGADLRASVCPSKLFVDHWAEIVNAAGRLGMPVVAAPLVDGKGGAESLAQALDMLRGIQEKSHLFVEFAPVFIGPSAVEERADAFERVLVFCAAARLFFGHRLKFFSFHWDCRDAAEAASSLRAGANDIRVDAACAGKACKAGPECLAAVERIVWDVGRRPRPLGRPQPAAAPPRALP